MILVTKTFDQARQRGHTLSTCLCVFSSHLFWTSGLWTYQPGSHRQEEGHTGFLLYLLSFCGACFVFLAKRIQPFLSLVDREVEFCVLNDLIVLHLLGIYFILLFYFLARKNSSRITGIRTQVPTCQKVSRLPTEPAPGRPALRITL